MTNYSRAGTARPTYYERVAATMVDILPDLSYPKVLSLLHDRFPTEAQLRSHIAQYETPTFKFVEETLQ